VRAGLRLQLWPASTTPCSGLWIDPKDYVIPNRRPAKNAERSHKVIYDTVKKVAERARVTTHVHALRSAFAVRFDDQHPREVIALKELLGHSRIETTMLYLRRKDKGSGVGAGPVVFPVTTLTASAPSGIRTRATTLKGWRPGPLVDGGGQARIAAGRAGLHVLARAGGSAG
jgi:hypothetical protein